MIAVADLLDLVVRYGRACTAQDPEAGVLLAQIDAAATRADRLRAVADAAIVWRQMRAGTPTKPKPESAALIAAVDALNDDKKAV